jgi:hypothetical protein
MSHQEKNIVLQGCRRTLEVMQPLQGRAAAIRRFRFFDLRPRLIFGSAKHSAESPRSRNVSDDPVVRVSATGARYSGVGVGRYL